MGIHMYQIITFIHLNKEEVEGEVELVVANY